MNIGNIMKPLQEKMGDVKDLLQSIVDNLETHTALLQKIYDKLPDNASDRVGKEMEEHDRDNEEMDKSCIPEKENESENKKQVCKNPEQSG